MRNGILVLVLAATLAACGFQLRGSQAGVGLDIGPIVVLGSQPESDLAERLGAALDRAGAGSEAVDRRASMLRLLSERWDDRPLTVDSNVQVLEFVTVYTVEFELADADGAIRVPKQRVELERVYTFDVEASGGTPAERSLIREELGRDMVGAIVRRLAAALRAD